MMTEQKYMSAKIFHKNEKLFLELNTEEEPNINDFKSIPFCETGNCPAYHEVLKEWTSNTKEYEVHREYEQKFIDICREISQTKGLSDEHGSFLPALKKGMVIPTEKIEVKEFYVEPKTGECTCAFSEAPCSFCERIRTIEYAILIKSKSKEEEKDDEIYGLKQELSSEIHEHKLTTYEKEKSEQLLDKMAEHLKNRLADKVNYDSLTIKTVNLLKEYQKYKDGDDE